MIGSLLFSACSSRGDKNTRGSVADMGRLAKASDKPTAIATQNGSAVESEPVNNRIELTANYHMQYSDTLFKVKAGEKVTLKLKISVRCLKTPLVTIHFAKNGY